MISLHFDPTYKPSPSPPTHSIFHMFHLYMPFIWGHPTPSPHIWNRISTYLFALILKYRETQYSTHIISTNEVAPEKIYNNIDRSLYSLIWDFLLSQINIWTTTTWSNVWVILSKPSWYEFFIGFLIWTPASKYLHLTTFSNNCVISSMFLYL
jgi:hypothetical protein